MWQALIAAARPVIRQVIASGIRAGTTSAASSAASGATNAAGATNTTNRTADLLSNIFSWFTSNVPTPPPNTPTGGGQAPPPPPPNTPTGGGQAPPPNNPFRLRDYIMPTEDGERNARDMLAAIMRRMATSAATSVAYTGIRMLTSTGGSDGHSPLTGSNRVFRDQMTAVPRALWDSRPTMTSMMYDPLMIGTTVGVFTRLTRATVDWGDALIESSRHLSQWNGTLAVAYEREKRATIAREIRSARATAPGTSRMMEQVDTLKDNLQPLKDLKTNISSFITEAFAAAINADIAIFKTVFSPLSDLGKVLTELSPAIKLLAMFTGGANEKSIPMSTRFFKEIADRGGKPEKFTRVWP